MSAKLIKGEMSCSRTNHNEIHMQIQCSESGARFVDMYISLEEFAKLVTGVHVSDIQITVCNLDRVGKRRVTEKRSIKYEGSSEYGSRKQWEAYIVENCQEEGWILNSTLNSQSSVEYVDGESILNYSVYKYVDI